MSVKQPTISTYQKEKFFLDFEPGDLIEFSRRGDISFTLVCSIVNKTISGLNHKCVKVYYLKNDFVAERRVWEFGGALKLMDGTVRIHREGNIIYEANRP